jgi:hypothetical protein
LSGKILAVLQAIHGGVCPVVFSGFSMLCRESLPSAVVSATEAGTVAKEESFHPGGADEKIIL